MIGEQKTKNDGYVNVSCKVPVWVAELLNIIADARGAKVYEIIQLCVNFIIETAKVDGPVPPQMRALLHMLKMSVDWNKAFSFSSHTATMDVAQCILILQQHHKKTHRNGYGMVMIDKPYLPGETPSMTTCVDSILERVAEVSMNDLYKELREVGVALDTQSLRETLTLLCDSALISHLNEDDKSELPNLGNFSDFGRVIELGKKTKVKQHRTPDSLANDRRLKIRFGDDDKDVGDE